MKTRVDIEVFFRERGQSVGAKLEADVRTAYEFALYEQEYLAKDVADALQSLLRIDQFSKAKESGVALPAGTAVMDVVANVRFNRQDEKKGVTYRVHYAIPRMCDLKDQDEIMSALIEIVKDKIAEYEAWLNQPGNEGRRTIRKGREGEYGLN